MRARIGGLKANAVIIREVNEAGRKERMEREGEEVKLWLEG